MSDPAIVPDTLHLRNELRKLWRKYVQRIWHNLEWPVIVLFIAIILGLGYIGLNAYNSSVGQAKSLPDTVYSILRFFILGSDYFSGPINLELQVVRLLAPIFPFYMILKMVGAVFYEQIQMFYLKWFVRDHAIICGMNKKGLMLAHDFYEQGYRLVVIDKSLSKDMLEKCRNMDAIVLSGDPEDPETLKKARIEKARFVISVLDNEGVNAEVAVNAGKLVRDTKNKVLTCYVHIDDVQLWSLLRGYQLGIGNIDSFRIEFVNIYNSGVRVLLDKYPVSKSKDTAGVDMMILGLGKMGENLAIETARKWFYTHPGEKLRIAIIDKDASDKKETLLSQYPRMADACDIIPVNTDIRSPKFLKSDQLKRIADTYVGSKVYICAGDDVAGVSIALSLLPIIKNKSISVVLCAEQDTGLSGLLKEADQKEGRLQIFSLLNQAYEHEVLLGGINAILARAIHEEYINRQKALGVSPSSNPSMAPWDELPEDLKESNRRSADHIMVKLHAIGCDIMPLDDWDAKTMEFTIKEIEKMSIMEHERWVKERFLQGFKYSPGQKNIEKKTSPYIIGWDRLPEDIKELDRNIIRNMPSFLAREGFRVYRLTNDAGPVEIEAIVKQL